MKVVIIGAGFGGLNAAKSLMSFKEVEVTIIDRHNYHLFQPLLYQVATAGLNPADIAAPIRSQFRNSKHIEVRLEEVIDIDRQLKVVTTNENSFNYDLLIVAAGAKNFYFGNTEWAAKAPGLKGLEDATEIRRRLFIAYENAEKAKTDIEKKMHMSFVLIGAGPTGVELAGSFAEIAHQVLRADFRHIKPDESKIILIEAGPRILPSFNQKLSQKAQKDLEGMGVTVLTNTRVIEINDNKVVLEDGVIDASTIAWSAGVTPSPLAKVLKTQLDNRGRVIINSTLSLKEDPSVLVLGDMASFQDGQSTLPGVASVAIQQGRYIKKIVKADLTKRTRPNFKYFDKGQMATIGRKKAVVQVGNIAFSGTIAWFAWLFVHLYYLIGMRNRAMVFAQWAWSYLTFRRGARLITPPRYSEDN